jgi:hypothetical protein
MLGARVRVSNVISLKIASSKLLDLKKVRKSKITENHFVNIFPEDF